MSDIAIKFENISKQYRLGTIGTGTISHDLNRWWHVVRGKEDPYLKIGEVNDRSSKATSDYVWALRDISFEVKQGEVLGIIGKNGAGKSTLLKILSRVTSPTTGTIKAKGRIASLLEVGTGFHPEMTGRENIYMNGSIMGMTKAEITRKLDEIVDFAGVEKYIDTPTKRYSSGMTVRLGFAIAAHLEPEILVVDEVLAVGDTEFQKKAIGKMQDVSRGEGRTVLFVSHNMAAVKNLCRTGVYLENGTVKFAGGIDDTIDYYLSLNQIESTVILEKKKFKNLYTAKIDKIELLDTSTYKSKSAFKMGENIGIRISFSIPETLNDLGVTVRMNDIYSNGIAAWRTKETGFTIDYKKDLSLYLEINNLNVFDGIYNLSFSLVNGKETIDFLDNAISFEIVASELEIFGGRAMTKSHNLIYTPCKWIEE
ncbi:ABC transporter ATP-binding protein [Dysgonomonas sp. ZJ709]|uniref:ABC transporter ATP-binding protein n=1 Tax=Dysgonomonas sp. ZJ709 TaxID=2709797 RepID=UPI0013EDD3EE|nr:ABC transporter ATP-binding protein [Dysgonomonas sp. ZJ709]